MKKKRDYDWINETTNTVAGITTPPDQADHAATDAISEVVEKTMDNIQEDLFGEDAATKKK